ncbi:SDR family NAD(P)-dependent oxidoreductase [Brevibacillus fulvus]|uniref:3-oxoacyl-[acyl-carrier protein] reductase n=1 Tax=Brevibacillus fulvus TaxID=1125967 RepID=A0A938XWX3_9BACL|nr:SDR family oxidoreductase [Brevibacillus fulvus]MBM7591697.1 3-oxoacyl-[acyl-carrier protein] reductase [Brevibacillus fulvus]
MADPTVKRNIVVVGGAAGIGREIARQFARSGDRVAVADINKQAIEELTADSEGSIFGYYVDVSSWESVCHWADDLIRRFPAIDSFIYSAGITNRRPFLEIDWPAWQKTMAVNLHGLFYCLKAVLPLMRQQQGASVVIIGSGSAITGTGGGVHYAASKGGAFGLLRALVAELGRKGIHCNVVAPRVIQSEMLDRLYPDPDDKQKLIDQIPIGRLGQPADIAALVRFLSQQEAQYIHGQIILADGGRTFQAD